jgi:HEAT repeat protein
VAAAAALLNIDLKWAANSAVAEAITSTIPVLIEAVESSGDRETRQSAAKALGLIGREAKAAIPALTRALEDKDRRIQDEAAKALAKIEDRPA